MIPLISVCIPTYNGTRYLEECIESVLGQTVTDLEVLLVDDASSDHTVTLARRFAAADRRVKVTVNRQNLGLVGNWNRCLDLATGEWIKFVFQDDFVEPRCVEALLARASPDRPFIACRRRALIEDVDPIAEQAMRRHLEDYDIERLFPGQRWITPEQFIAFAHRDVVGNFVGEPTGVLLHRDLFRQFGGFRTDLAHLCDWEYWLRVGTNVGMAYEPAALATFRYHGSGTTMHNREARKFTLETLDPLVVRHALTYDAQYAGFRALSRRKTFKFRNDLAVGAEAACRSVMESPQGPEGKVRREEWERVVAANPRLADLAQGPTVRVLRPWRRLRRSLGLGRRAVGTARRRVAQPT